MPPSKLRSRSRASFVPDAATIEKNLATLPVSTYEPGEMVIAAGETTGKLLFLSQGSVEVVKEGTQIALVSEPGAVFGELAGSVGSAPYRRRAGPRTVGVQCRRRSDFACKRSDRRALRRCHARRSTRRREWRARRGQARARDWQAPRRGRPDGRQGCRAFEQRGRHSGELASPGYVDTTARTGKAASDAPPAKLGSRSGAPLFRMLPRFRRVSRRCPSRPTNPERRCIAAGETSGKLLLLRKGLVEVVREGKQIARISEPGAVFGELAFLLDRPHSSDVRALERSEFSRRRRGDVARKRSDRRALRRFHPRWST